MNYKSLSMKLALAALISTQLAPLQANATRGPASSAEQICKEMFSLAKHKIKIEEAETTGVEVNGIAVTGPKWYATQDVLKNLAITPELAREWKEKRTKVISIGEGTGGLLPWLLDSGVRAWGLDLWYHQSVPFPKNEMGREMEAYQKKYGSHLINGDALNLKFKNDSVDFIVSNKLINNFTDMQMKVRFISEVLRVLKPGAEARLDFVTSHEAVILFGELDKQFPKSKIYEYNEEGMVGVVGMLPEAGFQIIRDDVSGVLFITKRRAFSDL